MVASVKEFFFGCYKKVFEGYFGYNYSERTKQDVELDRKTLEYLGAVEKINDFVEINGKVSDSKR